jgi:hypothetical protein
LECPGATTRAGRRSSRCPGRGCGNQSEPRPYDRVDPHFRGLPQTHPSAKRANRLRGGDSTGLYIGGKPNAAQLTLGDGGSLAVARSRVVGELQRLVERGGEVPGVVGHDDRRLMREGLDEVRPAEFGRVTPGLARGDFNQALDEERRVRPSRAAIGVNGRCVGVDCVDLAVDVGNVVLPREERRVRVGRDERRRRSTCIRRNWQLCAPGGP